MNKKKKSTNTSPYPDEVIDRLARAFYPAILACWNSEEGQREFAAWQAEQAHISGKEKQEVPAGELPALLIVCGFLQGASGWAHPVFVCAYFFRIRIAFRTAMIVTPTSPNTASHIPAMPSAPRTRNTLLMPRAITMFCITIRFVAFATSMQSAAFSRFSDKEGNWNGLSVSDVFGNEEIKIGYVDGWLSTSRNMVRVFVALALAVIIMLAPIFSGEYEGVDNIILTSKYGKTKCATAKVVAGIITAILTTTLIAAFNLLLAFVFYGTEGLDCSILFAPSDYVEAFIPFNITCGTLLKYQILLAFTCTLSVTGITLFLSAISKNQIVALVAAMAIFLFPVLLPITEVNPLFRLVGLLPIYHVLAISLLSVEQMSNGMLYAIWAIPAALLFLGVGAGISRRVFAKHQVL